MRREDRIEEWGECRERSGGGSRESSCRCNYDGYVDKKLSTVTLDLMGEGVKKRKRVDNWHFIVQIGVRVGWEKKILFW